MSVSVYSKKPEVENECATQALKGRYETLDDRLIEEKVFVGLKGAVWLP